jgi:PKD repeat protein
MMVNDLDLRLINQNNQSVTLPWRLNPDSVQNRAYKNDNSVDNVEKIELPGAVAGQTYTLRVSHKGQLFTNATIPQNQRFSLIVSGIMVGDTSRTCRPLQTYNSISGIFDDGSGAPKNYFNNADCSWLLNPADSNAVTQLIFRYFNVAAGDTLYAYSRGTTGDTLIAKFSGTALPDTIYSTTPQMYLRFLTDGAEIAPGWEVRYAAVQKPKFDFTANVRLLCSGSSNINLTVQAQSTFTTDWEYLWNIPGANISNPTIANPSVSFPTPGLYTVSLTVKNGVGSTTVTKTNFIAVGNGQAPNLAPNGEGFENASFPVFTGNPNLNWTTTADPNPWGRNISAPYQGSASARIRNNTTAVTVRELVSPAFDISSLQSNDRVLSFYMAFARTSTATAADQLRVLLSTNCGQTWTEVWKKNNTTAQKLSTIGDGPTDIIAGNFFPEPNQYRQEIISLSNLPQNTTTLNYKFEMTSQRGNFLYLDNVQLGPTISIDKLEKQRVFDVLLLPNPSSGGTNIQLRNLVSGPIEISLNDITGRVLKSTKVLEYPVEGHLKLSSQKLFGEVSKGIYFLKISEKGQEKLVKWIVQ